MSRKKQNAIRITGGKLEMVDIDSIKPYERNARIHDGEQIKQLRKSLRQFGFVSPALIDSAGNLIAGHGRVEAAKLEGMTQIPCVIADGLSEEQRRAYILADNRLAETSSWDEDLLKLELGDLQSLDFTLDAFGFDLEEMTVPGQSSDNEWFEKRDRFDNGDMDEQSDEYREFVEKFEPKRTTDDCYTPDEVYEAVADWVAQEYKLKREQFRRPFYPGGDYQKERYGKGAVVVDNPPFSILSEILNFYTENGVKFFLFAPALTLFSSSSQSACAIAVGADIVYENGASVATSFLTNLENDRVRTAPGLYQAVTAANKRVLAETKRELPKYEYPDEVLTAAMAAKYCKYGIDFRLKREESKQISALDAQKEQAKAIFGKGYLMSSKAAAEKAAAEKAAAEKAAAEKWRLSDREKEIVQRLGHD